MNKVAGGLKKFFNSQLEICCSNIKKIQLKELLNCEQKVLRKGNFKRFNLSIFFLFQWIGNLDEFLELFFNV